VKEPPSAQAVRDCLPGWKTEGPGRIFWRWLKAPAFWQRRLRSWCCRRQQRPTRLKGNKRVQATRFACAAPRFRTSTVSGPACTGTRRSLVLAAGGSSAPGHTDRGRAAAEYQTGNCAKLSKRADAGQRPKR